MRARPSIVLRTTPLFDRRQDDVRVFGLGKRRGSSTIRGDFDSADVERMRSSDPKAQAKFKRAPPRVRSGSLHGHCSSARRWFRVYSYEDPTGICTRAPSK